ncbi:MAG TPA: HupE/UreJ family protein [Gemmatimonadales bacterium]|nr:HupE/UreJ family protein [Gemmatimonadales bacterium]
MGSEFLTYLRLGMHHIADLRGYDHILFVAALTLAYRPAQWRRLLILVTAFTVGHSVTLALATLGLVRLPSAVVEAGIAATIIISSVVAVVLALKTPRAEGGPLARPTAEARPSAETLRYVLAAAFGLIHGLGFSTFLRSLLGAEDSLLVPLLAFNLGLEAGQLLIVTAVLVLGAMVEGYLRVSRRDWVLVMGSAIAALGLSMLLQRVIPAG